MLKKKFAGSFLSPWLLRGLRRNHKFSAYLSIYNDWDILLPALKSVAPYIDELLVVDGAYDWMLPYLEALGIDPLRSDERVYEALRASGIPFRSINRTWSNEIEKRRAGYEACSHRYVYRFDADEIFFFDCSKLKAFIDSGSAIAEVQMPVYVAPGWIVRYNDLPKMPCQCFLFDREQVSADIHLNYLWLILTKDELPSAGQKPFDVYADPIAYNAHLTLWRTPETAANRGAFYLMNWMRKNGVGWLPEMRGRPVENFRELFDKFPAAAFRDSLLCSSMGAMNLEPTEGLERTPLTAKAEEKFSGLYQTFLQKLVERNLQASTKPQTLISMQSSFIDISSDAARRALSPTMNKVRLAFSSALATAKLRLHTLQSVAPHYAVKDVSFSMVGTELSFELPPFSPNGSALLRQVIELVCSCKDDEFMCTYLVAP